MVYILVPHYSFLKKVICSDDGSKQQTRKTQSMGKSHEAGTYY